MDPASRLIDRKGRAQGALLLYGARGPTTMALLQRMRSLKVRDPLLAAVLAPEGQARNSHPGLKVWARHRMLGAVGDATPQLQSGDTEPGWVTLRAGSEVQLNYGHV